MRLISDLFPRASKYHPEWVIESAMGSNVLWLTEWLSELMHFETGMRVLDLGCGHAASSIFLAREFGVQVWATDLWISATEIQARVRDAGVEDRVYPLHADARALPYAADFFDAILCVDCYSYFGTDSLYLNYLANFVRPGGRIGVAGAAIENEIEGGVPEHLREMWTQDFWSLHSAAWWRRVWEPTGIVEIEAAEAMPEGGRLWLEWQQTSHPENRTEIEGVKADRGRNLGYFRMVGRRLAAAQLESYCWPDNLRSFPMEYQRKPLLRDDS
jgi:SAM-dependent methyltransferase